MTNIGKVVDNFSANLVGKLLKKVELVEKEKNSNLGLLKSLLKETVHEESRTLKRVLFCLGKGNNDLVDIIFTGMEDRNEEQK